MNKTGKAVLLIVLAAPVLVYAFLKIFGKNKFDLPVLHQSDVEWPAGCSKPDFPLVLGDSVLESLRIDHRAAIVVWGGIEAETRQRLPVEMDTVGVRIVEVQRAEWPCVFGAGEGTAAALVDDQGRIRSIYKQLGRDEADRLIMESKILLNDY